MDNPDDFNSYLKGTHHGNIHASAISGAPSNDPHERPRKIYLEVENPEYRI